MTASPSTNYLLNTEDNEKGFANVSEVTGYSQIKMEGFANQVRDFKGLARKPLCNEYRQIRDKDISRETGVVLLEIVKFRSSGRATEFQGA